MGRKSASDQQEVPYADTRPVRGRVNDGSRERELGELGVLSDKTATTAEFESLAGLKLPSPGDVIARKYRIEQRLGTGGMGAVFGATHLVTKKRVAIKWTLPSPASDETRKRFIREAQAAGRIDHPNVVDVYDFGVEGDYSYLVMELLRGEPLRKRLQRGPLAPAECIALLLPALRGVAAVHRAGVIHRDLKPDNIFLCHTEPGRPPEAKVLDFGISAIHSESVQDSQLTAVGMLLGTPSYMSPEQLDDPGSVDPRSDMFAIGVILYEALTGQRPFQGDSVRALMVAIAQREPVHPSELRPEVPRALGDVVLRAMAKDRGERWLSIDVLMDELAPFGGVRMPVARPRTRRGGLWLGMFVAFGLCLTAVLVVLWQKASVGSTQAARETLVRPALSVTVLPSAGSGAVAEVPEPVEARGKAPLLEAAQDVPPEKPVAKPSRARRESAVPPRVAPSSATQRVAPRPPSAAAVIEPSANPANPARSGVIELNEL